ncbi:substrate-binding domain-containing protein, partial [Acinetobacter baumannii]
DPAAPALIAAGIPLVLVDGEAPDGALASVAVDDVEGGYLATRHLLERGRRRIAFVGGPLAVRQVSDRLEGARRALAEIPDAGL